jgi:hypothetical protein
MAMTIDEQNRERERERERCKRMPTKRRIL